MFIKYYSSIYNINAAVKIFVSEPYQSDGREEQTIAFTFLEELTSSNKIQERRIVLVRSEDPIQFQRVLDYIDANTLATRVSS